MTPEINFRQWEGRAYGCGYGTGDEHFITALKGFLACTHEGDYGNSYDHSKLEERLGACTAWLMIGLLEKVGAIEWGSSARHGWLTEEGEAVRAFVEPRTVVDLLELVEDCEVNWCECDGKDSRLGPGHEDCGKNPMICWS